MLRKVKADVARRFGGLPELRACFRIDIVQAGSLCIALEALCTGALEALCTGSVRRLTSGKSAVLITCQATRQISVIQLAIGCEIH
jgi:hypothetical protein